MENHTATKSKLKLMKFLPKVANAVVSFQNPQFSPCRDKLTKSHFNNRGFSGPMMIPIEARTRKSKNNFIESQQEPTSPKVSCIGQIKHKKCINNKKKQSNNNSVSSKDLIKVVEIKPDLKQQQKKKKSLFKSSSFKNIFNSRRRSDPDRVKSAGSELAAPSLGQMRRFASSRDAFASFDWTANAQIAPDDDDDDDGDFRVPFSAPILIGDLEPRKEINLWKRRTMAKPEPLQLNVVNKL